MKDIMLRIVGNQRQGVLDADETETMELITEGRFFQKGDSLYLIYDESELSGVEGCTTSLKVTGGCVRMKRYGEAQGIHTAIEFEKGKKFSGYYDTPFGTIELEVLTNEITNELDPDGSGALDIDCSVCLKGLMESRNMLRFEIM